ncbi:MAG: MerR family transcriptional regulator [Sphingobium sp.]
MEKRDGAFLTIGELATELGVPHHILRYWEGRFPALRPLQRAGNRRYYRPEDVALARDINRLLNEEGYTVRGAQQALAGKSGKSEGAAASVKEEGTAKPAPSSRGGPSPRESHAPAMIAARVDPVILINRLKSAKEKLKAALEGQGGSTLQS